MAKLVAAPDLKSGSLRVSVRVRVRAFVLIIKKSKTCNVMMGLNTGELTSKAWIW